MGHKTCTPTAISAFQRISKVAFVPHTLSRHRVTSLLQGWSHKCHIVPHGPTHEERMPFNDLKKNDVDKGEK